MFSYVAVRVTRTLLVVFLTLSAVGKAAQAQGVYQTWPLAPGVTVSTNFYPSGAYQPSWAINHGGQQVVLNEDNRVVGNRYTLVQQERWTLQIGELHGKPVFGFGDGMKDCFAEIFNVPLDLNLDPQPLRLGPFRSPQGSACTSGANANVADYNADVSLSADYQGNIAMNVEFRILGRSHQVTYVLTAHNVAVTNTLTPDAARLQAAEAVRRDAARRETTTQAAAVRQSMPPQAAATRTNHEAPTLIPATALDRVLDTVIHADSQAWMVNHYDNGSAKNTKVVSRANGVQTIRGDYTYNGGTSGSVTAEMSGTDVKCVQFHDDSRCRPLGATVMMGILSDALAGALSGDSGPSQSSCDTGCQQERTFHEIQQNEERTKKYFPSPQ